MDGLKASHGDEKVYHDNALKELTAQHERIQQRLDKAYGDKLDGIITEEFWLSKSKEWRKEQEKVRDSIAAHEKANQNYFDQDVEMLKLANKAYDLYRVRNLSEKRAVLNVLVSNFTVNGENVVPTYKKPFDILVEGLSSPNWLPESDALQNGKGLLFEFPFGSINAAKGEKHLLPQETIDQAAHMTTFTIRARLGKDRLRLARHYDQLLRETPALTRKGLAGRLGITSARLNQILGLLKGGRGR